MYTASASSVRDTMILEVEIDETTKEVMGYGVKTNHIPKGFEGVGVFDRCRYGVSLSMFWGE